MNGAAWRVSGPVVTANRNGFGAEITGLDLSRPLSEAALSAIKRAWAQHSVVWFPDQPLDHDQLEAVTLQFGAFGSDPYIAPMPGHSNILEVRRVAGETTSPFGSAWHSDLSFQAEPPAATLVHAKIVPPKGGDILFADGYHAYETLSPLLQRMLENLRGVHSAVPPRPLGGAYSLDGGGRGVVMLSSPEAEQVQSHPIVRTHPVTGRRALFVNPVYTVGVEGMDDGEAKAMLDFLFKHMIEDAFIYRHKARADMLTIWDNRCVMHNATGGYDGHERLMHRTTVAGEAPA